MVVAAIAAMADMGCGGGSRPETVPVPVLSSSHDAQRTIRSLEAKFVDLPPDQRPKFEAELRGFLARHGNDDAARLAKVELAWLLVLQRKLGEAHRITIELREGPAGAVRDAAGVVEAAALRREGRTERSLALLEPLRGKFADPTWRGIHQSELAEAYVAARRFAAAMSSMLDWAEQAAPNERDGVVASVEALLQTMPAAALEAGIRDLSKLPVGERVPPSRVAAQKWLTSAARARLVRVALSERDPDLAKWLVETMPLRLGHDDARDALEALSATRAVPPSVAGRSIGVVLDVTDDRSRQRSADMVAGVSRALGLPASASRGDAVQLVTRDAAEAAEVDHALSGLAGDGASILVAGVTEESSLAASLFAERAEIPVIVLRRPAAASTPYSFVLGEEPAAEEAAMADALARVGARRVARVGFGGASCELSAGASTRFPVQEWKRASAEALVLVSDVLCANDAIAEAVRGGVSAYWVLGLEAGIARAPGKRVWVSSGRFPFAAHPVSAETKAWTERWGSEPSWYEVLGRDAAVLAARAMEGFPSSRVDDASAVRALHARAQRALLQAEAALWSTSARGFAGKNAISRQVQSVVEGARAP
jgi:hypothetical protein